MNKCFHQCQPGRSVDRQQPCARHGRERRCNQCLGVIGQTVLVVGVGPGVVKDVFAVGVVFQVQRAGGDQFEVGRAFLPQRDESRRPAGFGRGTATLVHGDQVFVAHEWVGIRLQCQQGIPLFCRYLQRRIQYANDIIIFTPSHHGIQCFHDS